MLAYEPLRLPLSKSLPPKSRTTFDSNGLKVRSGTKRRYPRFLGRATTLGDKLMARDLLLWLLGVPLGVIILLHLFGVMHW